MIIHNVSVIIVLSELEKHGDPDTAENVAYEARAGPTTAINPAYQTTVELEVARNTSN